MLGNCFNICKESKVLYIETMHFYYVRSLKCIPILCSGKVINRNYFIIGETTISDVIIFLCSYPPFLNAPSPFRSFY